MSGRYAVAVVASEPSEVIRLQGIIASDPSLRVVLAARERDVAASGALDWHRTPPGLVLDLLVASVSNAEPADIDRIGRWRAALHPRSGVVVITPPCSLRATCALASIGARHHLVAPVAPWTLIERLTECVHEADGTKALPEPVEQHEVDLALRAALAMVQRPMARLPKGFSQRTCDVIVEQLAIMGRATAQVVADATGLSRVSVRRYLELLAAQGRVEASHEYGGRGRPATHYELQRSPVRQA